MVHPTRYVEYAANTDAGCIHGPSLQLMSNLDFPKALAELGEAAEYLRSTGSSKVGVVGFCMGGALSFATAQHANVDCAAPFYGTPPAAICEVRCTCAEIDASGSSFLD